MILWNSIVPPYIVVLVRIVVTFSLFFCTIFLVLNIFLYIFSKNIQRKGLRKIRIRQSVTVIFIIIMIVLLLVAVENIVPRLYFGFSRNTFYYNTPY